jgi:hypothetical protein
VSRDATSTSRVLIGSDHCDYIGYLMDHKTLRKETEAECRAGEVFKVAPSDARTGLGYPVSRV